MKWQIITIGKPALSWAKSATEDYLKRLGRNAHVEMIPLRDGTPAQVAERILTASGSTLRIVLDERGKSVTSAGLAAWIERHHLAGTKRVSIIIGGANGHTDEVRGAADEMWCLSALTLQHEMALVIFLEQLYRAHSILRGDPYHRA